MAPEDPAPPAADDPAEQQARKFQRELTAGLTSLVLLATLADANEDLYGYQIARRLAGDRADAGPFKQGTLYPVLRNLSASGLLSSRVVPSYSGPPRRYYRITAQGHAILQQWLQTWTATRDYVDAVVLPRRTEETPA
jgi:PadR family transcriptional regulator, regulatory protein PadR